MEQTMSPESRWVSLRDSLSGMSGAVTCAEAARIQREVAALLADNCLPAQVRPLKIACLRSVTIEPVLPLLPAALAARDFAATVELGALGNYAGEMLADDSFVVRGRFDVCIVLLSWESLAAAAGDPQAEMGDAGHELQWFLHALDALAERFHGLIIVCNFAPPAFRLARRFQSQLPNGPRYALSRANRLLAEHVGPRANIVISDVEQLAQRLGTDNFYCSRNMMAMLQPFSVAGFQSVCDDWATLCSLHFRGSPKCIVVDCDGVLWGGIIGEDGLQGIQLGETYPGVCYQQFQRQLQQLKELGFLLALNSRNNEADIRTVFDRHPGMILKFDDFTAVRVNWNDKAANLAAIAEELNLGIESLVFVDDNPFELERAKSAHPRITCLQAPRETWNLPAMLPTTASLDRLSLTAEDTAKAAMYAQQRERKALSDRTASLDDYLRQLDLHLAIEQFSVDRHLARAVQLLQKTNQFNLTTRRYDESKIRDLQQAGATIHVASLRDRFGDYGRIGLSVVVFEPEGPVLDVFLMSCRALGRKAESVFLDFLKRRLRSLGLQQLRARFIPSGRNQMCADFLTQHGFELVGGPDADGVRTYRGTLSSHTEGIAALFQVSIEEEA